MNRIADTKLALGTAQFGFDYGINNKRGKIPQKKAFEILNFALQNGIEVIDTAYVYGDSEKVIGQFIQENKADFKVISKLPNSNAQNIENIFDDSLKRLQLDSIYGYLIHNIDSFIERPGIWEVLKQLKEQGKISKLGFSVYHPKEVECLLERNVQMDIIQAPFSIFDQRFSEIFPLLKRQHTEIHVRSIFLQGLVFKNPGELKGDFVKIKDRLLLLRALSKETNVPFGAIFINFAVLNNFVDKVILGIDSIENLRENVKALNYQKELKKVHNHLPDAREDDENIILPINWPATESYK